MPVLPGGFVLAIVDQHDQCIVIRVVYDGPPEAGKTTSVRALARGFGREVYTPEEQDGRTVYFDWLEHVGGRFDGAPIRCQIASVPGQQRWRRRRYHFIDTSDVVIFVGDTSSAGWSASVAAFRRLLQRLRRREDGPVGVVFQANRRDVADALPLAIVRERIGAENVAVIESVATDGTGVREAFVFAVRLALDRVREEQRQGRLPRGEPGAGGEDLLLALRRLEGEPIGDVDEPDEPTSAPIDRGAPRTPSHELPSGFVWPPVEGRIVFTRSAKFPKGLPRFTVMLESVAAEFPKLGAAELDIAVAKYRLAWARIKAAAKPSPHFRANPIAVA
jgi:signal recognition particle receptor subunit beta